MTERMSEDHKALNRLQADKFARSLDGRVPLIMIGYDPYTGEWRVLTHPFVMTMMQHKDRAEAFLEQIREVMLTATHSENVEMIDPDQEIRPVADLDELERMLGEDEGDAQPEE